MNLFFNSGCHFDKLPQKLVGWQVSQVKATARDLQVREKIEKGHYQLVFFTPEMILGSRSWRKVLTNTVYSKYLKALVVNEAHCVPKW